MAIYRLSKDAYSRLEEIYEYSLLNFGEAKAEEYFLSMHKTFDLLARQPNLGRRFHEFHRHEHGYHVFFYKITDFGIIILYILHQNEDITAKLIH